MSTDHHKFKIERVAFPEDPNRCQAVIKSRGQCLLRAVPTSKYCPCHGGNKAAEKQNKANIFRYRVAKYQVRLNELSDNNGIKSLRDEIAIVRFLIQKRLDFCTDRESFLNYHSLPLGHLILQVRSLAISCSKVEDSLQDVIDQESAMSIAHTLLTATYFVTKDSEILEAVSEGATEQLQRLYSRNTGKHASNYKIRRWTSELASFLTEERITSLRNEIGVLRLIVEELLDSCQDEHGLIFKSQLIISHIAQIEVLVKSCHSLENSSGLLLSEQDAMQFAQELITLIGNLVTDGDQLEKIAAYYDREMTSEND